MLAKMDPLERTKAIILGLRQIQGKSRREILANDDFPFPREIGVGDGQVIVVSSQIDTEIMHVADLLMAANLHVAQTYTRKEWRAVVRSAFGPALMLVDLDEDPALSAPSLLRAVTKAAIDNAKSNDLPTVFSFGCTLLGNEEIEPFSIGPVKIEPRLDWLNRMTLDGAISPVSKRRIEATWNGKKPGKRKPSFESFSENYVLEAVGKSPFVCSVQCSGFAPDAAHERALTAARLALASIALLWQGPAKALDGFNLNFDRQMHHRVHLRFVPGKSMLAGSSISHLPSGPWIKTGEWERIREQENDYFRVVGEVLQFILSPIATDRPKMMNALFQALHWFHEGCRQPVPRVAIINFTATMDGLACGKGVDGIIKLISVRLGLATDKPLFVHGPSLRNTVAKIYGEGRSRNVHGTSDKATQDWAGMRGQTEELARLCLRACVDWVARHPDSDAPSDLRCN